LLVLGGDVELSELTVLQHVLERNNNSHVVAVRIHGTSHALRHHAAHHRPAAHHLIAEEKHIDGVIIFCSCSGPSCS
jgi:hypothetical protein